VYNNYVKFEWDENKRKAIVRMTSEEMQTKYPLTKKALAKIEKACQKEPDMTDPDNPDVTELLAKGLARRVGRPKMEFIKEKINIRFDYDVAIALRSLGRGWSTQVNNVVRKFLIDNGVLAGH
jgi:uncharacterized protein (DUF4415 family)